MFSAKNLVVSEKLCNFAAGTNQLMLIMATVMDNRTGMTPMQLHLVSMLNFNRTEAAEQRLKAALEQFYLSEFERMKDEMRDSGALTEDIIAEGTSKHFRTAY